MENLPVVHQEKNQVKIVNGALAPEDIDGLWRVANIMAKSGLMPRGVETPEKVFVCVQMGLEVGLSPMQAVQNIAPINGRPSIWGDAQLALVRSSGLLEDIQEKLEGDGDKLTAVCTVKRKGYQSPVICDFSVDDAKKASLWGKAGPWTQYPKRMLKMRARSWALRDLFSDVLKGLPATEEAMDYDMDLAIQPNGTYSPKETSEDLTKKIKSASKKATDPQPIQDTVVENIEDATNPPQEYPAQDYATTVTVESILEKVDSALVSKKVTKDGMKKFKEWFLKQCQAESFSVDLGQYLLDNIDDQVRDYKIYLGTVK